MTNNNYSRVDWLNDLSVIKTKISNVIQKSKEEAAVLANFREEQQMITAKSIPTALYLKLACFTFVAMFMIICLGGQKMLPFAFLAVGLVLYIISLIKSNKKISALSLALMVAGSVITLIQLNYQIGAIIALIAIYLLIVAAEIVAVFFINASRQKKNQVVRAHNDQNQIVYDRVEQEFNELYTDLYQYANNIGYPVDYLSIDAADYFISAVKNYRADSYKDLVNLYIEELRYRAQQEHWVIQEAELASIREEQKISNILLQENNQQLKRLNALSAASMIQNAIHAGQITDAVNRNTASTNQVRNSVDSFHEDFNRVFRK